MRKKQSRQALPGIISGMIVAGAILAGQALSTWLALGAGWALASSVLLAAIGYWVASFAWSSWKA